MKAVINVLTDVAEGLRGEYEERNGKFHLKLEDQPPGYVKAEDLLAANAKVVEFRDKNITLLKENDELRPIKLQFEGIDPAAAKDALSKVAALGKKGIKDIEDFDARVKTTVDDVVKPLRDQLAASAAETAAERKRADEFLLHSTIADKFGKLGGKAKATDYIVGQAQSLFEVKDRAVVAKSGKFSTEKPGEVLTIDEWLKSTVKEHDFAYEASKGGGALPAPGDRSGHRSQPKPGQTILKNPTAQDLGAHAADIASGKVRVEYETANA